MNESNFKSITISFLLHIPYTTQPNNIISLIRYYYYSEVVLLGDLKKIINYCSNLLFPMLPLPLLSSTHTGLPPSSDLCNSLITETGGNGPFLFILSSERRNMIGIPSTLPWSCCNTNNTNNWKGETSPFMGKNVGSAVISGNWIALATGRDVVVKKLLVDENHIIFQNRRVRYDIVSLAMTEIKENCLLMALAGPRGVHIQLFDFSSVNNNNNNSNNTQQNMMSSSNIVITTLAQGYAIRWVSFFAQQQLLFVLTCTGHVGIWNVQNLLNKEDISTSESNNNKTASWTTVISSTIVTNVSFSTTGDVFTICGWEDSPKLPHVYVFRRRMTNTIQYDLLPSICDVINKSINIVNTTTTTNNDLLANPSLCIVSPCGSFIAFAWKCTLSIFDIRNEKNNIIAQWTISNGQPHYHNNNNTNQQREIVGLESVGMGKYQSQFSTATSNFTSHNVTNCILVFDNVGSLHCFPWISSSRGRSTTNNNHDATMVGGNSSLDYYHLLFPHSPFIDPIPKDFYLSSSSSIISHDDDHTSSELGSPLIVHVNRGGIFFSNHGTTSTNASSNQSNYNNNNTDIKPEIFPVLDAICVPNNNIIVAIDRITNELVIIHVNEKQQQRRQRITLISTNDKNKYDKSPFQLVHVTGPNNNNSSCTFVVLWRAFADGIGCETLLFDVNQGTIISRFSSNQYLSRDRFDSGNEYLTCKIRLFSASLNENNTNKPILRLDFHASGLIKDVSRIIIESISPSQLNKNILVPDSFYYPETDEWKFCSW
jgi:hypothetical protein